MLNFKSLIIQAKVAIEFAGYPVPEVDALMNMAATMESMKNHYYLSIFNHDFTLIGFCHLEKEIGKDIVFIHQIFVAQESRNQGIGSNLLQTVIDEFPNIHAFAFKENLPFFLKQGFTKSNPIKADFCPIDAQKTHPEGIFYIKKGDVPKSIFEKKHKEHLKIANLARHRKP